MINMGVCVCVGFEINKDDWQTLQLTKTLICARFLYTEEESICWAVNDTSSVCVDFENGRKLASSEVCVERGAQCGKYFFLFEKKRRFGALCVAPPTILLFYISFGILSDKQRKWFSSVIESSVRATRFLRTMKANGTIAT